MRKKPAKPAVDFRFTDHGSICLLQPLTDTAREWLQEHVCGENQYFGTALVVEPRYVNPLCEGIVEDGLRIANTGIGFH